MDFVWYVVVVLVALLFGVFGFSQIVGSIRARKHNTGAPVAVTVIAWLIVLGIVTTIICLCLSKYQIAYFIALGISLLLALFSGVGKDGPEE